MLEVKMSLRHLYKDLNHLGVYPDLYSGSRIERSGIVCGYIIGNKYYGWRFSKGHVGEINMILNTPYVYPPLSTFYFKDYKLDRCAVFIAGTTIYITFYDFGINGSLKYTFKYGNPCSIVDVRLYKRED